MNELEFETKTMYIVMDGEDLCLAFPTKEKADEHANYHGGLVVEKIVKQRRSSTFKLKSIAGASH